ncbi:amidohydrolase family protein [Kribbella sandramycini]|uniref:Amidohydrolase family protein n=1 Tax=Kribbella sandramycini TaxID=60450 RepID=A0A7Y4L658_9ACTN|nr:amidohydrolase family protein [Kribbella sandramycini]MBB6571508.1 imidazolonepropionase-like amidohydrolase [Kribbella sandramycini]NOL44157.1 amidohydrolase family protein [Kribbella sandramycini]
MAITFLRTRLIDRGQLLTDDCLRVADGRIAAIGGPEIARPGDQLFDGGTLLPGLIDAHVHLVPGASQLSATFGVTTLIDLFSKPDLITAERAAGADFRTSSIGATAPGGHPSLAYAPFPYVEGPADAEQFVADRIAEGADHLKLIYDDGSGHGLQMPSLDLATVEALTNAAHAQGLKVVAHISTASAAVAVAACGVDVLAHAPNDELSAEQVQALADAGIAVIATLDVIDGFGVLPLREEAELIARMPARWRRLLDSQARRWMPPQAPDGAAALANVLALHQAGVTILAGTDAPNPGLVFGASLHRELQHLVHAGLTPAEALTAATSGPAEVFGLADRGRIAVGARADLLLVDGDPLTDITATHRIRRTWLQGVEPTGYAGSDIELAGLAFIGETTTRIVNAIKEMWPNFPGPEDVLREDGELLGHVIPLTDGWEPITTFGAALGPVGEHDDAVATVERDGLASLAEPWWARTDGWVWEEATIVEAQPDRVRLRWNDPMREQPPSGQWYPLTDVDLSRTKP